MMNCLNCNALRLMYGGGMGEGGICFGRLVVQLSHSVRALMSMNCNVLRLLFVWEEAERNPVQSCGIFPTRTADEFCCCLFELPWTQIAEQGGEDAKSRPSMSSRVCSHSKTADGFV